MTDSMERHILCRDIEAFARDSLIFHIALAEILRNGIFKRILETAHDVLFKFLEESSKLHGAPERAFEYHKRILDAVAQKEVERAEIEKKDHLMDVSGVPHQNYSYDMEI